MEVLAGLLLLALLAAAWYFGQRSGRGRHDFQANSHYHYVKGINYLVSEQPDQAIDTFINSVEVNPETLETHFAIGSLMRQRGEVERAIRIHQNLLSRSNLTQKQLQQAQLELASDFLKAGLLDRAERLLLELVESDGDYRQQASMLLVDIYQDEHEWDKAIMAANHSHHGFFSAPDHKQAIKLSQFGCELATQALQKNDLTEADKRIKQAKKYNPPSVRVRLLEGELAERQDDYASAIKHYTSIPEQDVSMLPEALGCLQRCYERTGNRSEYVALLKEWLHQFGDARILIYLSRVGGKERLTQDERKYIASYLQHKPSAMGIRALLDIDVGACSEDNEQPQRARENLIMIKGMIDKLMEETPSYHCENCGFKGRQMHWRCPQCRSWETVKPARTF